jgi:hypothetical protein
VTVRRVPTSVTPSSDGTAAEWLVSRLWPWPNKEGHVEVGSIVPGGFSAYAAIRHRSGNEDDLSEHEARALVGVLTHFTDSPRACWFCVWNGYGDLDFTATGPPVVHNSDRQYLLYRGPLIALMEFPWEYPQIWWPNDRAWCVGSDMDLARTFVGGSEGCIAALTSPPQLDVEPVTLDVTVDETNHLPRLTTRG